MDIKLHKNNCINLTYEDVYGCKLPSISSNFGIILMAPFC